MRVMFLQFCSFYVYKVTQTPHNYSKCQLSVRNLLSINKQSLSHLIVLKGKGHNPNHREYTDLIPEEKWTSPAMIIIESKSDNNICYNIISVLEISSKLTLIQVILSLLAHQASFKSSIAVTFNFRVPKSNHQYFMYRFHSNLRYYNFN